MLCGERVDGLTRVSAGRRQWHSRYCAALFSLGHGVVVLSIALLAGMLGSKWVPPVGVRGRLVDRLLGPAERTSGPLAVIGVGSLFALSFDTLSQSALFAVMAVQFGGIAHAQTLGLLFVLGMLVSDGANGRWISRLIARTDRMAVVASRTMTLAVACVSLLVAAIGVARLTSGWIDGLLEGREPVIGLSVVALIGLSYLVACRTRRSMETVVAQR